MQGNCGVGCTTTTNKGIARGINTVTGTCGEEKTTDFGTC